MLFLHGHIFLLPVYLHRYIFGRKKFASRFVLEAETVIEAIIDTTVNLFDFL